MRRILILTFSIFYLLCDTYATRTTITFKEPLTQDPVINIPTTCPECTAKLVERFANSVTIHYEHPEKYVTQWQSFFPSNTISDVAELCGNEIIDLTEQCDDGNIIDSDACNNNCMLNSELLKSTDSPISVPTTVTLPESKPSSTTVTLPEPEHSQSFTANSFVTPIAKNTVPSIASPIESPTHPLTPLAATPTAVVLISTESANIEPPASPISATPTAVVLISTESANIEPPATPLAATPTTVVLISTETANIEPPATAVVLISTESSNIEPPATPLAATSAAVILISTKSANIDPPAPPLAATPTAVVLISTESANIEPPATPLAATPTAVVLISTESANIEPPATPLAATPTAVVLISTESANIEPPATPLAATPKAVVPVKLIPLPHVNGGSIRRLLQVNQMTITVRIFSDDISTAESVASGINLQNIVGFCNQTSNVSTSCFTAQTPTTSMETADTVLGPVTTELPGFQVISVIYQDSSLSWIIKARYKENVANTITSLYMPKIHAPLTSAINSYSTVETNSFFASKHPCMMSESICCALNYRDYYNVGKFASNITQTLGTCNADMSAKDTKDLFDTSGNSDLIDNFFANFGHSGCSLQRISVNEIDIKLSAIAIHDKFSMRSNIAGGGYTLEFFVGMTYITLLPTNAISTSVSQTRIVLTITNNLMFSISTQQDFTFVKYVTVALQQNNYVDGPYSRKMQTARVGIVLPKTMRQNMQTGLVPMNSIRYAISKSIPAITDTSKWNNPCYSTSGTSAMFDEIFGWKAYYLNSGAQTCALKQDHCLNPTTEYVNNGIDFFDLSEYFVC